MSLSTTTVYGNFVCDASGTNVANARISWQPVSSVTGKPISFCIGGGGQVSDQPVSTNVTNGSFSLTLADTSQTVPVNIGYKVTVVDNVSGRTLISYPCVQPTGAAWDFDLYQPSFPTATTNPGSSGGGVGQYQANITVSAGSPLTVTHNLNTLTPMVMINVTSGGTVWTVATVDANTVQITSLSGTINGEIYLIGGTPSSAPSQPSSPTPPVVTANPASLTVTSGNPASFSVAASGSPSPSVQWQTDSGSSGVTWSNISGATSTTYVLSSTNTGESGYRYRAVFVNSAGAATTSAAVLTVQTAQAAPHNAWTMNEGSGTTFIDSVAGANFALTSTVGWGDWLGTGAAPTVLFNGVNENATANDTLSSVLAANSPWSVEVYLSYATVPSPGGGLLWANTSNANNGVGLFIFPPNNLQVLMRDTSGGAIVVNVTTALPNNSRHMVAVTYDGSRHAAGIKIYIDGTLAGMSTAYDALDATAPITGANNLTLAGHPVAGRYIQVLFDHMKIFGVERTASEISARYATGV